MTNKDKMTNFRWVICAMLFFATTVNYPDLGRIHKTGIPLGRIPLWDSDFHILDNLCHQHGLRR